MSSPRSVRSFPRSRRGARTGQSNPRSQKGIGCERWAGSTKSDSSNEIASTEITTMGMFRKNFPEMPGTKSSGAKKTQVVMMEKQTGIATDLAPTTAAFSLETPSDRSWWIDSPTTIASSTTMPSVTMNAKSEIMLMETSTAGRKSSEPMKLIGIPSITQKAKRASRNKPSTRRTRIRPKAALRRRRSTRCE